MRIQWATTSTGTAAYTFPYNPTSIEASDDSYMTLQPCLGSETVSYLRPFDNRPIAFVWTNWSSDHTLFSGLVSTLVSGIGQKRYIKLNDVQPMFRTVFTTGWNSFRVENVTIKTGTCKIWEEVRLVLHKA